MKKIHNSVKWMKIMLENHSQERLTINSQAKN